MSHGDVIESSKPIRIFEASEASDATRILYIDSHPETNMELIQRFLGMHARGIYAMQGADSYQRAVQLFGENDLALYGLHEQLGDSIDFADQAIAAGLKTVVFSCDFRSRSELLKKGVDAFVGKDHDSPFKRLACTIDAVVHGYDASRPEHREIRGYLHPELVIGRGVQE
ncbi:MAG: hypothetical protein ABII01_06105 [Candidatus Woesearchaeota archaeon]